MQRLLWPMMGDHLTETTPDGYTISSFDPLIGEVQAVLAVLREPNAKHQWNVYTRCLTTDKKRWIYYDGMEFRHLEKRARAEFGRRVEALRGQADGS